MTCVSRVQNALQLIAGVSQVAIETAGITLMRQDLNTVADALAISQAALRNMKYNLPGAFIYNACGIPIAAGGLYPLTATLLSPVVAGAAMALSSITVVSNANRLSAPLHRRCNSVPPCGLLPCPSASYHASMV